MHNGHLNLFSVEVKAVTSPAQVSWVRDHDQPMAPVAMVWPVPHCQGPSPALPSPPVTGERPGQVTDTVTLTSLASQVTLAPGKPLDKMG